MTSRRSRKPTDSAPRSSPFQRIGTPTPDCTPGWRTLRRERHVVVVGGRRHRPPGRQHLAGDALAGREPVAEPLVGAVVPGGRERAAVDVEQVDAGHRAADGEVGLARERVEHGLELERDVERVRRAGQRVVALGLRDAAAARTPAGRGPARPGWRASRRSASRREPRRGRCGGRARRRGARRPPRRSGRAGRCARPGAWRSSAPSSATVRLSSSASDRAVAITCAAPGASGADSSAGATTSTPSTASALRASAANAASSSSSEHADSAASERRRSGACATCARVWDA